MRILIVNGPNIQLLGRREPDIYGRTTLAEIEETLRKTAADLGIAVDFFQSNHEGEILDKIASIPEPPYDGIVINPAALTHTSVALHDALRAVGIPAVEVHISNIYSREEFRRKSITASACLGVISGLGSDGYEWALRALARHIERNTKDERL